MSTSTSIPQPTLRRPTRWDFPFSDEMTTVDIDQICNIAPFSHLDENNFRKPFSIEQILRNDSRIRYCNPGDVVVREGEFGNSVFFVMFGRMRVSLDPRRAANRRSTQGRGGPLQTLLDWWAKRQAPEVRLQANHSQQFFERHDRDIGQQFLYLPDIGQSLRDDRTATLEAGQFFGEVAALGRTARCATITAETSAALFEIRWQGIRVIMRRDDCVKQYIEGSFRRRTLGPLLKNVPELKVLDATDIDELVKQAHFESYGEFRATKPSKSKDDSSELIGYASEPTIRKQDTRAHDIILLRTGVARVSYQTKDAQRTVSYLTPGQVFGLEELLSCQRDFRCSLHAMRHVSIVSIPRYLFENMLHVPPFGLTPRRQFLPTVSTAIEQTAERASNDLLSPAESNIHHSVQDFLRSRRYTAGLSTMMIDLDRCTRCDDCVRACASAHQGNPRFIRHGPTLQNRMLPTACLHCQDPICLIDCPTGTIHRHRVSGEVVINDQTCIGCASCANDCPFDAIRMVDIRDENGDFHVDDRGVPLQQATKCDLCVGRLGGPACQEACPHDALQRVDMTSMSWLC